MTVAEDATVLNLINALTALNIYSEFDLVTIYAAVWMGILRHKLLMDPLFA
jgi:hypothetical protein